MFLLQPLLLLVVLLLLLVFLLLLLLSGLVWLYLPACAAAGAAKQTGWVCFALLLSRFLGICAFRLCVLISSAGCPEGAAYTVTVGH